jgi:hypothetical protein
MKLFVTILVSLLIACNQIGNTNVNRYHDSSSIMINYEQEIRDVLEEEGLEPYVIELLVAQSKHESGNYRNSLTKYNNVFARHYHKTDTFATSAGAQAEGHSKFAKYPTIKSATLSQVYYLRRKKYSFEWKSTYQFAIELKSKHYYEAPIEEYVSSLNRYIKRSDS